MLLTDVDFREFCIRGPRPTLATLFFGAEELGWLLAVAGFTFLPRLLGLAACIRYVTPSASVALIMALSC